MYTVYINVGRMNGDLESINDPHLRSHIASIASLGRCVGGVSAEAEHGHGKISIFHIERTCAGHVQLGFGRFPCFYFHVLDMSSIFRKLERPLFLFLLIIPYVHH